MTPTRVYHRMVRTAAAALALPCLLLLGCERTIMDPGVAAGDDAALLRAAGVAPPDGRYTLSALVLEATQAVRQAQGETAARELLEPLRQSQALAAEAARTGDAPELAANLEELRQTQLAIALEVLGEAGIERVVAGGASEVQALGAALEAAAARGADVAALREQYGEAAAGLEQARAHLQAGELAAALETGTGAAERLVGVRRGIIDLERVPGLPELFGRAERALAAAHGEVEGAAALLLRHAELKDTARAVVASGNRERAHAALAAVRESELRIALQVLGPDVAAQVISAVTESLALLPPAARSSEPRLRRMLRAAADLHQRASHALERGDAVAALDLASYAAGLVNAYRLANTPF